MSTMIDLTSESQFDNSFTFQENSNKWLFPERIVFSIEQNEVTDA